MATYEYTCLACEHPFEEKRSISAAVDTLIVCPECGSARIRRRFSLFATAPSPGDSTAGAAPAAGGGCCGGACACGAR